MSSPKVFLITILAVIVTFLLGRFILRRQMKGYKKIQVDEQGMQ